MTCRVTLVHTRHLFVLLSAIYTDVRNISDKRRSSAVLFLAHDESLMAVFLWNLDSWDLNIHTD